MIATMVSGGLKAVVWGFAIAGFAALLLAGLIAWPLRPPPELASISAARKSIDFSTMPEVSRFQARDGTELAYRHYPAHAPARDRIAVVVHGSSGSSRGAIHALSLALAARGVQTYAVDIRGHGESGKPRRHRLSGPTRRRHGRSGRRNPQNQSDRAADADRSFRPAADLRCASPAPPIQNLFTRTVLLAPYLGYDAPSSRPNSGGWASPDIPRFIALSVLRGLGMTCGGIAAGDCVRGAAEFGQGADHDLFLPADAQFRRIAGFSHRSCRGDQAGDDLLGLCRRTDGVGQISRGRRRPGRP